MIKSAHLGRKYQSYVYKALLAPVTILRASVPEKPIHWRYDNHLALLGLSLAINRSPEYDYTEQD